MILFGLLAGYFTLFMSGFGVAILIMSRSTRINIIECACLAWLFGVGVISISLWLGGTVAQGAALQLVVSLVCLALAFMGWRVKKNKGVKFALPLPSSPIEWLLTALLLLELLALFIVSLKHTLGWDGLFNWEIKARYAFLNNGVLPSSYYSSPGRAFSHPEYPLAIPFTELWLYLWMGVPHQFWIKTIFPLFYIAGALLTSLFVTRLTGKRWLGLLIALLLPFVPFVTASPGGVIVGYADIPLSVFYVAAFGYLLCSLEFDMTYSVVAFAAMLTLIPWIKSEGVILWALLGFMSLVLPLRQRQIRLGILSILPGLVLIVGWRFYLHVVHTSRPSDFAQPSLQLLSRNLSRLGAITSAAFDELTETTHWSIFWALAFIAIVYLLTSRQLSRIVVAIGVVTPLVLYLLTYIFSEWSSYTAHVTSSLPRLLLHIMPIAWLAIGLAVALPSREEKKLGS
jgi:hypothetical protein